MKSINVQYFALLREQRGVESESIQVPCRTYADLYQHLKDKYSFTLLVEMVQVAVNDEFSHMNHEVLNGARIVYIPPVAGG